MIDDAKSSYREPIQGYLSFPTSENLTEQNTEDGSYSLRESPANLQVVPGSSEAKRMTAGSGRKLLELYRKQSPLGACLKTLLESETWASEEYLLTWRPKGTKQSCSVFQLVPSIPRNSGTGIGSWGTPCARDEKDVCPSGSRVEVASRLLRQVHRATWPTVRKAMRESEASCVKRAQEDYHSNLEETAIMLGQTPSGSLALTESFVERLTTLSAWLMGYTVAYLQGWETRLSRKSRTK